jgi:hypothetical protein
MGISRRAARWVMVLASVVPAVALAPAPARAGGLPFPSAISVFVPADRPDEILVGTNFGLVHSDDGGASWTWSCDQGLLPRWPYQLGPAPRHRLFSFGGGLAYSDDDGCNWQPSGGLVAAGYQAGGVFVDPSNADRVLASASLADGDGGYSFAVLASGDGGGTFDSVRYASAVNVISSLEGAPGDPATIYLTLYTGPSGAPMLVRSLDGGATWQPFDLSADIGPGTVAVVAVDPTRADRVFLRQFTTPDEALVIVEGGAATATRALAITNGASFAFVRAANGTILVSALVGGTPALFRSRDDGASFEPLAGTPRAVALAERDGVFYAAMDGRYEFTALETSTDEGATWQPAMSFAQLQAITACAKAACQTSCADWSNAGLWPAAFCSADAPVRPDAGAGVDALARPDADAGDASAAAVDGAAPDARASVDARAGRDARDDLAASSGCGSSGCGCSLQSDPRSAIWILDAIAAGFALRLRRSRAARACGGPAPARRAGDVRASGDRARPARPR